MTLLKLTRPPRPCATQGCNYKHTANGYCRKHYRQHKNTGRLCTIEGCGEQYECSGYCKNHYWRWRTHGDPHFVKADHGKGRTRKEKFWSKVDKTPGFGPNGDCWEWTGKITVYGYAAVSVNAKAIPVHRAGWYYTFGKMPSLWLLHSCDNRKCVNPDHLREGTHRENTDDMVLRNRQSKGEHRPNSKLTEDDIRAIRAAKNVWGVQTELSKQYGINTGAISRIRRGLIWKHVK